MEARWWVLLAVAVLSAAVWWGLSRAAHVRRGLRAPYARQKGGDRR
ncbi:hypothetical protein ACQEU8_02265 [Streptomyces sp. CA-250714]